jgi:hypothetical protein
MKKLFNAIWNLSYEQHNTIMLACAILLALVLFIVRVYMYDKNANAEATASTSVLEEDCDFHNIYEEYIELQIEQLQMNRACAVLPTEHILGDTKLMNACMGEPAFPWFTTTCTELRQRVMNKHAWLQSRINVVDEACAAAYIDCAAIKRIRIF